MFDLHSGYEINAQSMSNITKGDNAKSKKGRVVIFVRNALSCPVLHFYQVPLKYSERYSSDRADTISFSNKTKGDKYKRKKRKKKPGLLFWYMSFRLILFYIPSQYHKNIPKGSDLPSGHEVNA